MNDTKHAKNTKHAELRGLIAVVIAVAMFIGVLIAVAWLREGQGPIQGPPQQGLQT